MPAKVNCNIKLNRLYITISGSITKSELNKLYTEIRFCVADLRPGFVVINDFSQGSFGNLDGVPTFRKIMKFLKENKVGRVIRVTGNKKILFYQIMRLCQSLQEYKTDYVNNMVEAEELLAQESLEENG